VDGRTAASIMQMTGVEESANSASRSIQLDEFGE
jgi:hypothetical protein